MNKDQTIDKVIKDFREGFTREDGLLDIGKYDEMVVKDFLRTKLQEAWEAALKIGYNKGYNAKNFLPLDDFSAEKKREGFYEGFSQALDEAIAVVNNMKAKAYEDEFVFEAKIENDVITALTALRETQ